MALTGQNNKSEEATSSSEHRTSQSYRLPRFFQCRTSAQRMQAPHNQQPPSSAKQSEQCSLLRPFTSVSPDLATTTEGERQANEADAPGQRRRNCRKEPERTFQRHTENLAYRRRT